MHDAKRLYTLTNNKKKQNVDHRPLLLTLVKLAYRNYGFGVNINVVIAGYVTG